ncbi:hypothetical protein [Glycomyces tritici]|uniref:Uncharacterized protein n=1 Tax=Glycomyces tritici TaxID=2665176 RepID=A0ABT7YU00_9ACTN|nr:hypothetical protein [Glycomyces tritici]MDN3242093.1 hypothetical protein [Glycomyces tritici]
MAVIAGGVVVAGHRDGRLVLWRGVAMTGGVWLVVLEAGSLS